MQKERIKVAEGKNKSKYNHKIMKRYKKEHKITEGGNRQGHKNNRKTLASEEGENEERKKKVSSSTRL